MPILIEVRESFSSCTVADMADMADRKGRSVLLKLRWKTSVRRIKRGTSDEIADGITVFQDLGNNEYLIELQTKAGADLLIEEGFDMDEVHVCCHPPHGFYINVSILGLRSYVSIWGSQRRSYQIEVQGRP